MKLRIIKFLCFILITACSSVINLATIEKVPYEYFGQIKLSEPQYSSQKTIIPFSVSGGENRFDSAIILRKITAKENDGKIKVSLYKSVANSTEPKLELVLKNLRRGNYRVYYVNPNGSEKYIQTVNVK
jgi:hypothetical protein